jgi:polysaccharide export outer membrane protein
MSRNRFCGRLLTALLTVASWAGAQSTVAKNSEAGVAPANAVNVPSRTAVPAPGEALRVPREFRIGSGDILAIDVYKEPDASSPTVPVRPDGKISAPMIGEVQAAGLSPSELEVALAEKYREFIRGPRITVIVKEINSMKVYVIGEVKKEGPIRFQAPITVLQALAEAGGVTDYAKRRKIYILRTEQDHRVILPFDYDAVVRGGKVGDNIALVSGDTVVVPR